MITLLAPFQVSAKFSFVFLGGRVPALANMLACASQQASQLRPRATPPAECHDLKINIGS